MKRSVARYWLSAAIAMSIVGCGGGSDSDDSGGSSSGGEDATDTEVSRAIDQLETRGEIPQLDFSDDLAGEDQDGNGVRDDVDRYIDNLPDTAPEKQSLRQLSAVYRESTIIAGDSSLSENTIRERNRQLSEAINCIHLTYASPKAGKRVEQIRKVNVNTEERFNAHIRLSKQSDGMVINLPSGDTCDES